MLYTIGDLHLSLGTDKPMDIFPGWGNHVEKIEANWNSKITDEDTVVLLGDHSWALKLEESYKGPRVYPLRKLRVRRFSSRATTICGGPR